MIIYIYVYSNIYIYMYIPPVIFPVTTNQLLVIFWRSPPKQPASANTSAHRRRLKERHVVDVTWFG